MLAGLKSRRAPEAVPHLVSFARAPTDRRGCHRQLAQIGRVDAGEFSGRYAAPLNDLANSGVHAQLHPIWRVTSQGERLRRPPSQCQRTGADCVPDLDLLIDSHRHLPVVESMPCAELG